MSRQSEIDNLKEKLKPLIACSASEMCVEGIDCQKCETLNEEAEEIAIALIDEHKVGTKDRFEIEVWRGEKPYKGHKHSIHNHKFCIDPIDYKLT